MRSFIVLLFLLPLLSFAQESPKADSAVVSLYAFISIVEQNHPLAKRAGLVADYGDREVQHARGNFDPVLDAKYGSKDLKGTDYYDYLEAGLLVPTRLGVDLFADYMNNTGEFVNPKDITSDDGLWRVGVSVPLLGQGLFFDNRRLALQQAQNFRELSRFEQINLLNDLYFQAISNYLKWSISLQELVMYQEAERASLERFENTRLQYLAEDAAAIDTLDAYNQWRKWQVKRNEAELKLFMQQQKCATFIWDEEGNPLQFSESALPEPIDSVGIVNLSGSVINELDSLLAVHPEIRQKELSISNYEFDRRLAYEKLRPKLNADYSVLISGDTGTDELDQISGANNIIGLSFEMPILLRTERAKIAMSNNKILQGKYELDYKRLAIEARLRNAQKAIETYGRQQNMNREIAINSDRLVEAEQTKFDNGESSMFNLNIRQIKNVEAQLDYYKTQFRYLESIPLFYMETGILHSEWPLFIQN